MTPDLQPGPSAARLAMAAVVPLALLVLLLAWIVRLAPGPQRGDAAPPVERLAFERARLGDAGITVTVLNDGPDAVTIAQVAVDDAYWQFSAPTGTVLRHLERTELQIPYPWVAGEAHVVRIVTSTGATFDHDIAVAVATPRIDGQFFATFTLIGLYVGVIPVALGLMWYPLVARLTRTALDFLLAVTVGLLLFLLIDSVHEGLEAAGESPGTYQAVTLFVAVAAFAYLALESVARWLRLRRRAAAGSAGALIALLVAVGIGLHNFGEGLAIGGAYALGEAALGTLLVIGFTLHNTTEGLAIVAPLAGERPSMLALARLGAIGGGPTIAGAWLGGMVQSPLVAVIALGLGAGAIAQVLLQIARQIAGGEPLAARFATPAVLAGTAAGFAIMYATGLLVG
jgi:zinc transporter, ZIP family